MCFNKSNTALGINNGNRTEWSAILAEITSMISDQNCMTWGSVTTLLHPFWNRPNTGLGQFLYFIDTVLSRFEIKLIHFGGGGVGKIKKLQNLPHNTLCLSIWLVTLNKPWNLIGCFAFSVTCSLVGKKMRFKAKMVWFENKSHQLEPIRLQRPPVISKWV